MQLAECLRVNASLKSLNLYGFGFINGIGDVGATQLAECLRVNTTLKILYIAENNIGAEAMRALKAACPPQCELFDFTVLVD